MSKCIYVAEQVTKIDKALEGTNPQYAYSYIRIKDTTIAVKTERLRKFLATEQRFWKKELAHE